MTINRKWVKAEDAPDHFRNGERVWFQHETSQCEVRLFNGDYSRDPTHCSGYFYMRYDLPDINEASIYLPTPKKPWSDKEF